MALDLDAAGRERLSAPKMGHQTGEDLRFALPICQVVSRKVGYLFVLQM